MGYGRGGLFGSEVNEGEGEEGSEEGNDITPLRDVRFFNKHKGDLMTVYVIPINRDRLSRSPEFTLGTFWRTCSEYRKVYKLYRVDVI